ASYLIKFSSWSFTFHQRSRGQQLIWGNTNCACAFFNAGLVIHLGRTANEVSQDFLRVHIRIHDVFALSDKTFSALRIIATIADILQLPIRSSQFTWL